MRKTAQSVRALFPSYVGTDQKKVEHPVKKRQANGKAGSDLREEHSHEAGPCSSDSNIVEKHGRKHKLEESGVSPLHDDSSKQQKKSVHYCLKGYVAERQGEREDMQDAHVILDDFTDQFENLHPTISRLGYYAVFDGHGGSRASRFASESLHVNLREKFPKGNLQQVEKEIKKAIISAFKKTDDDFLRQARQPKPSWKDGSTAVMVIAVNDTLYVANLGDSKAILCRYKAELGKHVPIPLTTDHNPAMYEERVRIQKAGGNVKDGRVMGVLEVSRSIGDGPYKNHGVSCLPDVKRCQLTEDDQFVLIACDGLWKSIPIDESIQRINTILQDEPSLPVSGNKIRRDTQFEVACNKLASDAVLRLSADNVTVLIVAIDKNT